MVNRYSASGSSDLSSRTARRFPGLAKVISVFGRQTESLAVRLKHS